MQIWRGRLWAQLNRHDGVAFNAVSLLTDRTEQISRLQIECGAFCVFSFRVPVSIRRDARVEEGEGWHAASLGDNKSGALFSFRHTHTHSSFHLISFFLILCVLRFSNRGLDAFYKWLLYGNLETIWRVGLVFLFNFLVCTVAGRGIVVENEWALHSACVQAQLWANTFRHTHSQNG